MKKQTVLSLAIVLIVTVLVFGAAAQDDPLIGIGSSDMMDAFLVGPDGMTLYSFDRDMPGVSNCVDGCAENWPPLTVESEDDLSAAEGIPGTLSTVEREDGSLQVAYNGMPLYYWVQDEAVGDTTGDGRGGVWWIVEPATVYIAGNEELGSFLVGENGFTLYILTADEENSSVCTEQCLENWPALTVESADDLFAGRNLPGEFAVFERADTGELQVSYNGQPLYYWVNDEAIGDATGQGVNDVWFVVHPETIAVGGNDELGEFLVAPNGYTLYILTADEENSSVCTEQCLENWPALTVGPNDVLVLPEGVMGELSTFERADTGALQVTLNGMPLYYWVNDEAPGDATGQGVSEVWFVVSPDGEVVQ